MLIIHSRTFPLYCICIANSCLLMSNSVITKFRLYRRLFLLKSDFRLFTTACVELDVKIVVGKRVKQYECQTRLCTFFHQTIAFNSVQFNPFLLLIANYPGVFDLNIRKLAVSFKYCLSAPFDETTFSSQYF